MSSRSVRWPSSRTIDSIQKKDANRRPACDRLDAVERGRRVEDHVAGGQLDLMLAIAVLDDQLAAVIVVGLGQEERRRQVGPDPPAAIGQEADGIVDMVAEAMALGARRSG